MMMTDDRIYLADGSEIAVVANGIPMAKLRWVVWREWPGKPPHPGRYSTTLHMLCESGETDGELLCSFAVPQGAEVFYYDEVEGNHPIATLPCCAFCVYEARKEGFEYLLAGLQDDRRILRSPAFEQAVCDRLYGGGALLDDLRPRVS